MSTAGDHDDSSLEGLSAASRDAVERIRRDRKHGASWLAREAASALTVVADDETAATGARLAQAHLLARALAQARPSMAAIAMVAAHVWWAAREQAAGDDARLGALRSASDGVIARWDATVTEMTQWARAHVTGTVYTLSRSGSVEGTLTALARERTASDPLRVFVAESRPGGEGVGLAQALARAGAQVTLVPDGASAALIDQAALALVGADSVRADGSVVNKVGTHTLALVARQAGKPVYALAESLKITPPSYPLVIEELPPELSAEQLAPASIPGLTTRAIVFDVTPARLLTGMVTESGQLDASEFARLVAQAERAWQALMAPPE